MKNLDKIMQNWTPHPLLSTMVTAALLELSNTNIKTTVHWEIQLPPVDEHTTILCNYYQ